MKIKVSPYGSTHLVTETGSTRPWNIQRDRHTANYASLWVYDKQIVSLTATYINTQGEPTVYRP